jgi:hypothetical protein
MYIDLSGPYRTTPEDVSRARSCARRWGLKRSWVRWFQSRLPIIHPWGDRCKNPAHEPFARFLGPSMGFAASEGHWTLFQPDSVVFVIDVALHIQMSSKCSREDAWDLPAGYQGCSEDFVCHGHATEERVQRWRSLPPFSAERSRKVLTRTV